MQALPGSSRPLRLPSQSRKTSSLQGEEKKGVEIEARWPTARSSAMRFGVSEVGQGAGHPRGQRLDSFLGQQSRRRDAQPARGAHLGLWRA